MIKVLIFLALTGSAYAKTGEVLDIGDTCPAPADKKFKETPPKQDEAPPPEQPKSGIVEKKAPKPKPT